MSTGQAETGSGDASPSGSEVCSEEDYEPSSSQPTTHAQRGELKGKIRSLQYRKKGFIARKEKAASQGRHKGQIEIVSKLPNMTSV